jgi:hypothetical protein
MASAARATGELISKFRVPYTEDAVNKQISESGDEEEKSLLNKVKDTLSIPFTSVAARVPTVKAQVALATYRKNRGDVPTGGRHKSRRHRHRRTRSRKPSRK